MLELVAVELILGVVAANIISLKEEERETRLRGYYKE
jgi:hypothetical protein